LENLGAWGAKPPELSSSSTPAYAVNMLPHTSRRFGCSIHSFLAPPRAERELCASSSRAHMPHVPQFLLVTLAHALHGSSQPDPGCTTVGFGSNRPILNSIQYRFPVFLISVHRFPLDSDQFPRITVRFTPIQSRFRPFLDRFNPVSCIFASISAGTTRFSPVSYHFLPGLISSNHLQAHEKEKRKKRAVQTATSRTPRASQV